MRASVWLQHVLPHGLMARVVHAAAHSRRGFIRRPLIHWFAAHYAIDLDEAAEPDLERYPTFNAFFTRALKVGARTPAGGPATVVSPVDGKLTEFGEASDGQLIQAKGFDYPVTELVGEGPVPAAAFARASYATIYLAPHNYHRVHMPLDGALVATRYIPGRRFSVNAATTQGIPNLFCRNERVVCWFETAAGPMALVLVGAMNVASISTVNRGEIASGTPHYWPEQVPLVLAKGAEVAAFNLGSTVVLLFAEQAVRWLETLEPGNALQLGHALGERRAQREPPQLEA